MWVVVMDRIGLSAAVLADQGQVTMVDINERAVLLSRDNAKRNGINNVQSCKVICWLK